MRNNKVILFPGTRIAEANTMIHSHISLATTIAYGGFAFAVLLFQETTNYLAMLPDTTLAGLGLAFTAVGGIVSYFWENKRTGKASLRTNIAFAIFVGLVVGLLTYNSLVVERHLVTLWMALLLISGFANQGCLILIQKAFHKKAMDILHITDADLEKNGRKRKIPQQRKKSGV